MKKVIIRKRPTKNGTTIGEALRQLFPDGYFDHSGYVATNKNPAAEPRLCVDFSNPPCFAPDLFAIAGFLLMKSGGYQRICPHVKGADPKGMVVIEESDRRKWIAAGKAWRGAGKNPVPPPPAELVRAWNELKKYFGNPLFLHRSIERGSRPWWKDVAALLAIADEAAMDVGFVTGKGNTAQAVISDTAMRSVKGKGVFTISSANSDQICVLPKSRTPKVGCTIRSLSHHLALLPPRGMARVYWRPYAKSVLKPPPVSMPFNLIIVPLPFQVQAQAFKGTESKEASWGWFHVSPHWCPGSDRTVEIDDGFDAFWAFIESVLERAKRDVGIVHGLVFPEAALSHAVFQKLCSKLQGREGFELLVSGLFDLIEPDKGCRKGNFAAMARRRPAGVSSEFDVSIREKHHRWRVEKSQIENYSLGGALDSNVGWWEDIKIIDRSLDVFVIRGGATVTTLICEDLARSEPCQELVRGIGPNLVIALLMDGPQLKDRWPARYATVLAEDPGSSVLTVTSMGLINRSNQAGQYPPSDKMALWRDDTGKTTELSLGKSAQALMITLQPTKIRERTMDGRHDEAGAQSWRLTGIAPINVNNPNQRILNGFWPEGSLAKP